MNTMTPDELLQSALKTHDVEQIMEAIECGANPDVKIGFSPLGLMCYLKKPHEARKIIEAGADVNFVNGFQKYNLSIACDSFEDKREDVAALVQLLLENGANPNLALSEQNSPLNYAAMYGMYEAVDLLLEYGAHVNHFGKYGRTPIIHAAASPRPSPQLILSLLEAGADINSTHKGGQNPFYSLIESAHYPENSAEIARVLIQNGIDLDARTTYFPSYIHSAAYNGKTDILKVLLEETPLDINLKDKQGRTPLLRALSNSNTSLETVRFLFSAGADFEREGKGLSLLEFATRHKNLDFIKEILSKKKDKTNSEGALCTAAKRGDLELVQFFLEEAKINIEDPSVYSTSTALLQACTYGRLPIVEYLVKKGASLKATDYKGNTPLLVAASKGHCKIIAFLLTHGSDINECNAYNWNALMQAVFESKEEAVDLLLKQGSALDVIDKEYGCTVLSIAEDKASPVIVSLLKENGAKERPIYIRSESQAYLTIFDCDICQYLENQKDLPDIEHMSHIKHLKCIFFEEIHGYHNNWSRNRLLRCPNCTTHYYQSYSQEEDEVGFRPAHIIHKFKRCNYLHADALLQEVKKETDRKILQENHATTVQKYIEELSKNNNINPYYWHYVIETVEDYLILNEDWTQFEKQLLQHKNPHIVLRVIQDWAHMCNPKTYDNTIKSFFTNKSLTKTQQKQYQPFLQKNTSKVLSYLTKYETLDDQSLKKLYAGTISAVRYYIKHP